MKRWEELRRIVACDDHVQAVLRTIAAIDLQPLYNAYRGTGSKPFDPVCMFSIALVEILSGATSPAAWYRDARTRDQCKFVGYGIAPSRSAWYGFRDRCSKFIDDVHRSLVADAITKGHIAPRQCCLDGTFTAAAASRHKIFSLRQINRRRQKLKCAIRQMDNPDQIAAKRDLLTVPKWIARTTRGRMQQLGQYTAAKRRILENIEKNRLKPSRYRKDESSMVISPADIDAVIGRDKLKVLRPLYNTQIMTDCDSDVIIAFDVFAKQSDHGALAPMIRKSQQVVGEILETVHADSAYCSILDLQDCEKLKVSLYAPVQNNTLSSKKLANGKQQIASQEFRFEDLTGRMICPGGHEMKFIKEVQVARADGRTLGELRFEQSREHCSSCVLASRCLGNGSRHRSVARQTHQKLLEDQKLKMDSEAGKRSVALRSQTIERRFADGKQHRNQSVQNGRGSSRVYAEVGLLAVAQNTLTLFNQEKRRLKAVS